MTLKRTSLIRLSDGCDYHCVPCCVRRSFLCDVAAALWVVIYFTVINSDEVGQEIGY